MCVFKKNLRDLKVNFYLFLFAEILRVFILSLMTKYVSRRKYVW